MSDNQPSYENEDENGQASDLDAKKELEPYLSGEAFDPDPKNAPTSVEQIDAAYCLRFLRSIRDCAFATTDEEDLPAVRIIDVMMVSTEPLRLYFLTPRGKSFHADLLRDKFVALVGQSPDYRTCRLRGEVVHPEDPEVQKQLVDAMFSLNPSMNLLYPGSKRQIIDAFYIENAEGEYFDLGQRPLLRAPFIMGTGVPDANHEMGYFITDRCMACGTCYAECPSSCIEPGDIYKIEQEHCQHCGTCMEVCPFDAVELRDMNAIISGH